ncbi:hypothetical protein BD309DRAFT_961907 [Dichomitus squalens]|uniref:Uncharacterized protein n=1 Tax=Dichomitus squalens TaxID=114155 RepID=A0A4Q9PJ80_9APHY|nr:hypothetical protein BD309DRAFT_961907 [Dichomitus squalens]TBU54143.1 hypothetical protein BD310DRAFT_936600 [Dichomitus squalens]
MVQCPWRGERTIARRSAKAVLVCSQLSRKTDVCKAALSLRHPSVLEERSLRTQRGDDYSFLVTRPAARRRRRRVSRPRLVYRLTNALYIDRCPSKERTCRYNIRAIGRREDANSHWDARANCKRDGARDETLGRTLVGRRAHLDRPVPRLHQCPAVRRAMP